MFSDEPVQIFGSSRQQIARGNSASLDINLKHSIELLNQNSVAPNTYQLYERRFSAFVEFRQKFGLAFLMNGLLSVIPLLEVIIHI
jgi:hypothetical protein